jgi:hypothetical protein
MRIVLAVALLMLLDYAQATVLVDTIAPVVQAQWKQIAAAVAPR